MINSTTQLHTLQPMESNSKIIEIENLTKVKPDFKNIHQLIKDEMLFDKDGKCINAFKILSDPFLLALAYNTIKSNPGNMVEGIDNMTLDGIDWDWFVSTSNSLTREAWKPNPVRRIFIPKTNGKMRPIGISSPRDKIVQQALKLTLETILEVKFSDCSHGFRPNRGCHTALREVRKWKGVSWLVEGDIVGFFDNIDHHILENLLKNHFNEARLIHLYWKFAKAGYVEWDKNKKTFVNSEKGVPQGSIISPLLSNLILNSFDSVIEEIIKEYNNKSEGIKPSITNPEYHKLTMRISRLNKKIIKLRSTNQDFLPEKREFISLIRKRRNLKSLKPNPDYVKIKYVRYADDWLIGVWGNKEKALQLKNIAARALSDLNLELSTEKTLITNARSDRAKFLGTFIKRLASSVGTSFIRRNNRSRRAPTGNIWMSAPILELVKKLEERGFFIRKGHKWLPKTITKFTLIPVSDIIIRYNSIVTGICNYYSFADNRRRLNKIIWILKESLKKTLMRKLKLNKRILIRKFGKDISLKIYDKVKRSNKIVQFIQPDLTRRPMLFLGKAIFGDPFNALNQKVSTQNPLGQACTKCGTSLNIEMHHIKHIKTINVKLSHFDKMVAKINRKQVPLCRKCHIEVHKGSYTGQSIKYMNMSWKNIRDHHDQSVGQENK